MARVVHIALKVEDLERATAFYEDVFGFRQTGTGYARGHVSRHITDGAMDVALMVYDNEQVHEAQLSGAGPCIHHWGIEVEDRDATVKSILANGGQIVSEPGEGALKFRAPDGTVAEIVGPGRYKKQGKTGAARIVRLAIQVTDVEAAKRFYGTVFGFQQVRAESDSRAESCHLTDGTFDLVLTSRATEDAHPPVAAPRLHHWGIEVDGSAAYAGHIAMRGGTILSKPDSASIEFRAPDGTRAEIIGVGSLEALAQHA